MVNLLAVAAGGAIGAMLRYLVVNAATISGVTFPLGTLVVNVLGSLLIGILFGYWLLAIETPTLTRLFLQTGVLGAFTTFSAFSLDTLTLWQNGQIKAAVLNAALNLLLCLLAVAAGVAFGANLQR